MKHAIVGAVALGALALGLSACNKQPAQPEQLTLHEVMKNEIDANADKVWDVTNDALGEKAEMVSSKKSDGQCAKLEEYVSLSAVGVLLFVALSSSFLVV